MPGIQIAHLILPQANAFWIQDVEELTNLANRLATLVRFNEVGMKP